MPIIHVISCSTGKDSVATLLIAKQRFGAHRVVGILCDTGNEHELVFQHRAYLEKETGIKIIILTANFDQEIAIKRMFVARDSRHRREYETIPVFEKDGKTPVWKRDGFNNLVMKDVKKGGVVVGQEPVQKRIKIGSGRLNRWTNKAKRRAIPELYPTGNPFLDLCMWKGRFPSRAAQFCTQELKTKMAVDFQLNLIDQGYTVVSWQGVRRDESEKRKNAKLFEKLDTRLFVYRPIVEWAADDTFAFAAQFNIEPNPLYKCGMGRVGCMPCINASKDEIKEISRRFPEHIEKIAVWEKKVAACSKRQAATFMPAPSKGAVIFDKKKYALDNNIYSIVEWSRTSRGGKQFSLLTDLEDTHQCSSAYGLCE